MKFTETIGFKNNNYGNIRHNPKLNWQGQTGENKGFAVFDSPENGVRAIAKILLTYKKRGKDTLEKIINTYAPPSENDTKKYISFVSTSTGITPTQKLKLDATELYKIISAIIQKEIGYKAKPETITKGIESIKRPIYKNPNIILPLVLIFFLAFIWNYKN